MTTKSIFKGPPPSIVSVLVRHVRDLNGKGRNPGTRVLNNLTAPSFRLLSLDFQGLLEAKESSGLDVQKFRQLSDRRQSKVLFTNDQIIERRTGKMVSRLIDPKVVNRLVAPFLNKLFAIQSELFKPFPL